jgi:probable phosphoglycerate mutase
MAAEIYLVRHGETEWNRDLRVQGRLDSPLTPRGCEQVRRIGQMLVRIGIGPLPVSVSPLGRTRATAEILAKEVAFGPVTLEPRLMELSLGSWDGMTLEQIKADFSTLLEGSTKHDWYFRAPDGESFDEASRRVGTWLAEQTEPVIAIAHGMIGRAMRAVYLGLSREEVLAHPLRQTVVWHFHDGQLTVLTAEQTEPSPSP